MEERNVFICPLWFILLCLATIVAIITTIVMIVKKHKKAKK